MPADEGVKLADENHFDFTMDEYLGLIQAVGSPHFGMCFDTGNCLRNGDEPVASARRLGEARLRDPYQGRGTALRRDPKDWMYFACTPVGKGMVNFPGLVAELERPGYNGPVRRGDGLHGPRSTRRRTSP